MLLALVLSGCGDDGDATTDTPGTSTEAGTTDDVVTEGATAPTSSGSSDGDTGSSTAADTTAADTTAADTTAADTTAETGDSTTGGGLADCGFDPTAVYSRTAEVFQLVSEDGASCVWLKRRDDSEPDIIYKAVPYTLLEFKAGHAGEVTHLSDPASMTWESTHHNWNDVAEAWDAEVRFRLEDWYTSDQGGESFTDKYALTARDPATDAVLWGPVVLYPYGG